MARKVKVNKNKYIVVKRKVNVSIIGDEKTALIKWIDRKLLGILDLWLTQWPKRLISDYWRNSDAGGSSTYLNKKGK